MSDALSPKTSPQVLTRGIRRLNDRPLYIVLGAIGLFLIIVVWVAVHRAQETTATESEQQKGGSTLQMAKTIVAGQDEGFIAVEQAAAPMTTAPTRAASTEQPEEEVTLAQDNTDEAATPTLQQEEQLRIAQAKSQLFEQAVSSKIAVSLVDEPPDRVSEPQTDSSSPYPHTSTNYPRPAMMATPSNNAVNTRGFGVAAAATKPSSSQSLQAFDQNTAEDRWALSATVTPPRSPYELRAGSIIPAMMISGINSDLPGQVIAQISQPVYDTATGKYLLLPQGTRLIGSYANDVAYGQERVFMAWQRLVFPDGKALDIGAMPGTDAAGYAGFSDQVNHHYWRIFGSAFLMSGITAGLTLSQGSQNNQGQGNTNSNNNKKRINDVLTEALGQQLGTVITKMIEKNLNIAPTLEIRPGYRFNVMVVKDIGFTAPYQPFDYNKTKREPR